jgi:hypothetical protein
LNKLQMAAVLLLFSAAALGGASPKPAVDPAKALESVRGAALQYTHKLPDFICEQITHRSMSRLSATDVGSGISSNLNPNVPLVIPSAGTAHDVIDETLTFIGGRENYAVLSVNGKKVSGIDHMQFQGATSTGEFGSLLHDIFDPQSQAALRLDRIENRRGHPVYVFAFRVPQENGRIVLYRETGQQIVVAYEGKVMVDADSLDVLQISTTLDLPAHFPIQRGQINVQYRRATIENKSYNLPYRSEVQIEDRSSHYVNTIEFRGYHKFAAESTIHY